MLGEQVVDGVRWLTLNRPEQLNAFTARGYEELGRAIEAGGRDESTRVMVLTGAGRAFSAGADRSLLDGSLDPVERQRAADAFRSMVLTLGRCEKPIVAAVNGLAVGVGATILLHCDLLLFADCARIKMPFTELGLAPEAASSVLLPSRVLWGDAMWLLLSSEWIDAEEARAIGLAWRIVVADELLSTAGEVASRLASLDPAAVVATKRLLLHGRKELVEAAYGREMAEMSRLVDNRGQG